MIIYSFVFNTFVVGNMIIKQYLTLMLIIIPGVNNEDISLVFTPDYTV